MHRRPFKQFDEMLDRLTERFEEEYEEMSEEVGSTAVDVAEDDGEYVVIADLPGFEADDIDVRITDRTLHIAAEHKAEREPDVDEYHLRERAYRSVSRSVRLPGDIEKTDIDATYEDGVLTVTIPKHEAEAETTEGIRIDIS